jgi:phosphoribosylaminoimidazolecarboxamide formyltransferase/IMP cyclohydrolase
MNHVNEVDDRVRIRRVLVSVSNKAGLEELVDALMSVSDLQIVSTGGTYDRISEIMGSSHADRLTPVSAYTGQPEMQGGLVKTLDFKIYLGLLSEPYNREHDADRSRIDAELIDMVVVNLYPFAEVVAKRDSDAEDARSNIDIGGPTMLRAAAKSYLRVVPLCNPSDYSAVCQELRESDGYISFETRLALAKKAFAHTAEYERVIADYFASLSSATAQSPYKLHERGGNA